MNGAGNHRVGHDGSLYPSALCGTVIQSECYIYIREHRWLCRCTLALRGYERTDYRRIELLVMIAFPQLRPGEELQFSVVEAAHITVHGSYYIVSY